MDKLRKKVEEEMLRQQKEVEERGKKAYDEMLYNNKTVFIGKIERNEEEENRDVVKRGERGPYMNKAARELKLLEDSEINLDDLL